MCAVIGIPRALAYYYYHTMWTTFFSELGFQVKTSRVTDRSVIEHGITHVPNEACLPLKCYAGHVAQLYEQHGDEQIDWIFIPRLVCTQSKPSVKLCCPKFIGLPDMVHALMPDAPILSLDIDLRIRPEREAFLALAERLACSARPARHAYEAAVNASRVGRDEPAPEVLKTPALTIALLGHRYVLEDPYLCLDIRRRLVRNGCRVIEDSTFPFAGNHHHESRVCPTSWQFEDDILFAAYRFLHQSTVDGIVYLLSFGCGAGSITSEIIEHELREDSHVPILRIIIDEHTAEAGFLTRLESFVDMIRIKKIHTGVA